MKQQFISANILFPDSFDKLDHARGITGLPISGSVLQVEKKAKTEKQPEIQAPAEAAKQPEAEERSATEPKMPASGMAAGVPAAGQQGMVPAAAARPSAAQPPPHIAAPVQALPPPEPRWAPQATPFALACRFFDRDLAGYIEADDLEEILVMVSDAIPRESGP